MLLLLLLVLQLLTIGGGFDPDKTGNDDGESLSTIVLRNPVGFNFGIPPANRPPRPIGAALLLLLLLILLLLLLLLMVLLLAVFPDDELTADVGPFFTLPVRKKNESYKLI